MNSSRATLQSAATGTGNGTPIDVANYDVVGLQVTGISGDTITWEASIDNTNWAAVLATPLATGTAATTATANGLYVLDVAGLAFFRARVSTFSAGTITVIALLRSRRDT